MGLEGPGLQQRAMNVSFPWEAITLGGTALSEGSFWGGAKLGSLGADSGKAEGTGHTEDNGVCGNR